MYKALMLAAAVGVALAGVALRQGNAAPPAPDLGIVFADYEPQKVVYHIDAGANRLGSEHRHRLAVIRSHVRALPAGTSDLRVVLQADGLDLLVAARKDPSLAGQIDELKAAGVRFLICANTVTARKLDAERVLHGMDRADVIRSSVAEISRLQAQGYVYLKI